MARKTEQTVITDRIIGIKINELRIAKGMSRVQLAAQIGVTHQQVQKYEKGTNRITAGRLLAIAEVFKVEVQSFFDSIEEFQPLPTNRQRLTMELVREFSKISDEGIKQAMVILARSLARTNNCTN